MKRIRLGVGFVNQTVLDWAGNAAHLRAVLDLARKQGVGYLCLPELALCGYGAEDLFLSPAFRARSLEQLAAVLPHTKGLVTCLGLPLEFEGAVYNAVAVVADGRLLGIVPKQALAGDGIHYEPRWFKAWQAGRLARLKVNGQETRLGDLVFNFDGVLLGFEICQDAWEKDRPAPRLAARGVNLIYCPAASHFAFGKTKVRRELGVKAARTHALAYAYANLMGDESGRAIFDGSGYVLAPGGGMVAEGARFSYRAFGLSAGVLELKPRPLEDEGTRVEAGFAPPAVPTEVPVSPAIPAQRFEDSPHEELARGLPLGLFDYLRKSKAKGFALSLSGGADSGATAVLVRLMAEQALAELGPEGLAAALPSVGWPAAPFDAAGAMAVLLRTLYQGTANSSNATRLAAREIAAACGARHTAAEIQSVVDANRTLAESALGRRLTWDGDDATLQNLQARVRSPLVWALANAEGRLLLATNNRSEAAAGYTTMDGDSSGGLAPLAGLGKHFLRAWLRWMEETGPEGRGPLPALKVVNALEPTAELRPPASQQTDEGDLMPYEALDAIQHALLAERLGPKQTADAVAKRLPKFDAPQVRAWVLKACRLWASSQWKRERLAPSFHLDDHNVDPRTWLRFPILNGGWEEELAQLEQGK